ncbi:MAG: hypothetical protein NZ455_14680 [Bacteroidia bacterium]|nr:hypothetical protein [Bacteroidia bacterium]
MKKFIKSIVFAAAMLLSVSVWAGNPENVPMCNNVQNVQAIQTAITVETLTAPDIQDVQQKPCSVSMTICGHTEIVYVGSFSNKKCKEIQDAITILADVFNVILGCI